MQTSRQGLAVFSLVLVLIGTLVVIQLWLLSAALEALLARDTGLLVPATVASLVLFLMNGGLLLLGMRVDRRR